MKVNIVILTNRVMTNMALGILLITRAETGKYGEERFKGVS